MRLLSYLILLIVFSCTNSTKDKKEIPLLFELLPDSLTNINFNNKVVETALMNALNYDYMYNGSGVSVGDFNSDGLADIYFAANHIPNKLYLNKGDFKFEDVTNISATGGNPGFHTGTTVVDIDADGLLDIYVCKSGAFKEPEKRKNELFINQGNNANGIPVFKEEASKYQLDLSHYSTQASFFDYDKDGDLDVFLINHNVNSQIHYELEKYRNQKSAEVSDRLFRNDNNKFIDVSEAAGIINDGIGFGLGLAIGDLNNDNWPDIIVGQDFASKDRIYLNQQNGSFKEIIEEATGHISNFSMGNDIADFNNDGWLDFMSLDMVSEDNYGIKASMSGMNPERFNKMLKEGFHHQYMYNTLQLNNGIAGNGNPCFSDIAELAGVSSTDWSWGPLFFDMDNDGDKDLFISNGIKRDFRNVDYIHYRERAEQEYLEKVKNVSSTLKAVIQQQHDADLIRRMPPRKKSNYFYENNGDLSFAKRNMEWAIEKMDASNGAAYADLDNDGDLDLVTNNMDDVASIYRNNSIELGLGNFIKLKLKGPKNNPNGIGARVSIIANSKKQISEQYVSRGFQSSVDNILHFGLGEEKEIEQISITWPDGKEQRLQPQKINQTLILSYFEAEAVAETAKHIAPLFTTITAASGLNHFAVENDFDDFERESLLPHKMSQEGPALAMGDIDGDSLDDFYVGGAKGQSGKLYIQNSEGKFKTSPQPAFQKSKPYEDVDAVFFDADKDSDLDLYVVSGSNEYETGSEFYLDRIYINEKGQFQKAINPFDQNMAVSGSVVRPNDFDSDGDLDLFVGGRQAPGQYPQSGTSLLWRNDSEKGKIHFTRIEEKLLDKLGMITDADWSDVDGDDIKDLIIVGEWMPIKIFKNSGTAFTDLSKNANLEKETGWWFSVEAADFDQDGDMDIIAGNLGRNSKYQASPDAPFQIFADDFDQTGSLDIVLGYHQEGEVYPLRGRECSSNQMPFIKKKFPDYHTFASANIEEVYGKENLENSLQFSATNFATTYLENTGAGQFKIMALPNPAQLTTTRKIIAEDVNSDGNLDVLLFGNLYGFEVETPRQDAGYGLILLGNGNGDFQPMMPYESGLFAKGEVADAVPISMVNGNRAFLIAKNNDYLQLVAKKKTGLINK